ncbi:MAG TPA: hypothetical protein VE990_10330 [Acidimicrobiales bacterium]|nr:hypothetical protein [Acidimicrobiales bacterium]
MPVVSVRYSERPELWERITDLSAEVWPEYNRHGDVVGPYWDSLYQVFPDFQFVLYDEDADEVLAEGQTIPVAWTGREEDLGPGIDHSIAAGFDLAGSGGTPDALCALAAEIPPRHRQRGLATVILGAMADLGRDDGLGWLIAPVRPNWKERYPLAPVERYAAWTLPSGEAFDPWIRIHLRLGARLGPALPQSMRITGTVAEWESWTGMAFPDPGEYVFPHGLATLRVDRQADVGSYSEPNVWLIHDLRSRP